MTNDESNGGESKHEQGNEIGLGITFGTGVGVAFGAGIGVVFGSAFGNVGMGIPIGGAFGMSIGLVICLLVARSKHDGQC